MENERENLMKRLSEASFAIDEVKLFLDNNPTDQKALDLSLIHI